MALLTGSAKKVYGYGHPNLHIAACRPSSSCGCLLFAPCCLPSVPTKTEKVKAFFSRVCYQIPVHDPINKPIKEYYSSPISSIRPRTASSISPPTCHNVRPLKSPQTLVFPIHSYPHNLPLETVVRIALAVVPSIA